MIEIEIRKVVEEVISEAKRKAEEILEEGGRERERILFEARKEVEMKKDEMQKEADLAVKKIETIEATKSRMDSKEILQKTRMKIIEDIYREFYGGLDVEGTLKSMHSIGIKSIKNAGAVYVSENDFEAAKRIFPDVKKSGIKGGIVIESADGRESVNLSMEVIDEIFRNRTFPGVYEILFGERKAKAK
ncbi:MAG: hypothetical protein HYW26_01490 [Candidatus Aenigmarchaeota archaeon]|nr:hypothetical protein [Candidatus Aenigmarchaeota archaeon]